MPKHDVEDSLEGDSTGQEIVILARSAFEIFLPADVYPLGPDTSDRCTGTPKHTILSTPFQLCVFIWLKIFIAVISHRYFDAANYEYANNALKLTDMLSMREPSFDIASDTSLSPSRFSKSHHAWNRFATLFNHYKRPFRKDLSFLASAIRRALVLYRSSDCYCRR